MTKKKSKKSVKATFDIVQVVFEIRFPRDSDEDHLKMAAEFAQLPNFAGFKSESTSDERIIRVEMYQDPKSTTAAYDNQKAINGVLEDKFGFHTPWGDDLRALHESYREFVSRM